MNIPFSNILQKLIYPILALIILILIFQKMNWLPDPAGWFQSKPVTIEETQILVSEIKQIAELQTAKMYSEMVVDSFMLNQNSFALKALQDAIFRPFSLYPGLPSGNKLVLVVSGSVIAGIDLKQLGDSSIQIIGDSVSLTLPSSRILEVITNPSGFDVFVEEGNWSQQAVLAVKEKARQKMVNEALRRGLIGKANQQALQMMRRFLEAVGFIKITIQFEA